LPLIRRCADYWYAYGCDRLLVLVGRFRLLRRPGRPGG
jgi:hypothetical protein